MAEGGIFNVTGNRGAVQGALQHLPTLYLVQLVLAFLAPRTLTSGTRTSGLTARGSAGRRLVTVPRAPQWLSEQEDSSSASVLHALPRPGGARPYLSFPRGSRGRTLLWTWAVLGRAAPAHWARTAASVGGRKCAVFGEAGQRGRAAVAAVAAGVRSGTGGSD